MKEVKVYTVLVAPLDWGLGHATRCVPIIRALKKQGYAVIIAANHTQQKFFELEFPDNRIVYLEGYNIQYASGKTGTRLKLLSQLPSFWKSVKREHQWLAEFIKDNSIDLVISDNRYGLYNQSIPSVLITHQLNIISGNRLSESFIRKIHYKMIKPYTECWVPDLPGEANLAGRLSHPSAMPSFPVKYIGLLSRWLENNNQKTEPVYKCCIILSGPEPQRTILEKKVLNNIGNLPYKIVLVRGLPSEQTPISVPDNVTCFNHLPGNKLIQKVMDSEMIISRGGYTTLMEMVTLQKKLILIPTPAQTEQEYLAAIWTQKQWAYTVNQNRFNLQDSISKAEQFIYSYPEIDAEKNAGYLQSAINNLTLLIETKKDS